MKELVWEAPHGNVSYYLHCKSVRGDLSFSQQVGKCRITVGCGDIMLIQVEECSYRHALKRFEATLYQFPLSLILIAPVDPRLALLQWHAAWYDVSH